MKTNIFKYAIPFGDHPKLLTPGKPVILDAQFQIDTLVLWAIVEPENKDQFETEFAIYGTGNFAEMPGKIKQTHIATLQSSDKIHVWHLFKVGESIKQ